MGEHVRANGVGAHGRARVRLGRNVRRGMPGDSRTPGAERGALAGVDETADETVAEADDDVDAEVALLLWVGLTWALLL